MTWVYKNTSNWIQRLCFYILKHCLVPKHIGIIMDGNRRFAKQNCVHKSEGHRKGFDKLAEMLQWCLDVDISEVTVYAFSLKNFERDKDEVDALLNLAKEKFEILIKEWKKLRQHGIRIRVIGDLTLLPKDLIALITIAVLITRHNNQAFLNIAFSYIGKEEIASTSTHIVSGANGGDIEITDVTEQLLQNCLYTFYSEDPDLMICTSGEIRFSDFMMWQNAGSYYHFINVLWPNFTAWNLISALFEFQHFYGKMRIPVEKECERISPSQENFSKYVQRQRFDTLLNFCSDDGCLQDFCLIETYTLEQLYDYYQAHVASAKS